MARVYATEEDYQTWSGDIAATVSDALLARASLDVDEALIGAVYDVDVTTLLPTQADVIQALSDATCAQVEWFDEIGDTTGAGTATQFQSASIGSASYTRGSSSGTAAAGIAKLGPRAFTVLNVAGLLTSTVYTNG